MNFMITTNHKHIYIYTHTYIHIHTHKRESQAKHFKNSKTIREETKIKEKEKNYINNQKTINGKYIPVSNHVFSNQRERIRENI